MNTNLPSGYDRAELVRHPEHGDTAKVRLHVRQSTGYVDGPWLAAGTAREQVDAYMRPTKDAVRP